MKQWRNLFRHITPGILMIAAISVALLFMAMWSNGTQSIVIKKNHHDQPPNKSNRDGISNKDCNVSGGHWEYMAKNEVPYHFSYNTCMDTQLHPADCIKTQSCPQDLMNWRYYCNDDKPYQRFDVDGFRMRMRNRRIVFVGDSTARQQVEALIWTLGHKKVDWKLYKGPKRAKHGRCPGRFCMIDELSNAKICFQAMTTMATKVYREGNYTLVHSSRKNGDSSCLLYDKVIGELSKFDLVFVQGLVWWAGLPKVLNSTTSPSEWIASLVPTVYRDAMGELLSKISPRTKTILVLGQVGTSCINKTEPEPFSLEDIPGLFNWNLAPKMWNAVLDVIDERALAVQVVDARDPLMQSVHAHPSYLNDCLHFCMNSAAVNIYLDIYWKEVFSKCV